MVNDLAWSTGMSRPPAEHILSSLIWASYDHLTVNDAWESHDGIELPINLHPAMVYTMFIQPISVKSLGMADQVSSRCQIKLIYFYLGGWKFPKKWSLCHRTRGRVRHVLRGKVSWRIKGPSPPCSSPPWAKCRLEAAAAARSAPEEKYFGILKPTQTRRIGGLEVDVQLIQGGWCL